ncbi:hypothetical protein AA0473_0626 [Acetobacter orleanensis NRIC 0473]|uniref:Resolvase HTH domain-containing protein n=1 Tax=Acetobacter orleanensis TaxID=104099 RepID=A0A4Y3TN59_9PROT|nr:hypothetical protein Abol_022_015 [Acetobacter orleanensis JCM 7639]GBR24403.1 hypothetical protein AA0473_0626 [Acetobacter orleanensis NRIC 0473]GEB83292.1 hypothetical protein AOR01nite_17690 [Acetobacter orleanensis]
MAGLDITTNERLIFAIFAGLAKAAMGKSEIRIADLCAELGITRQTLYRHVTPKGQIRPDGEKLLARKPR